MEIQLEKQAFERKKEEACFFPQKLLCNEILTSALIEL